MITSSSVTSNLAQLACTAAKEYNMIRAVKTLENSYAYSIGFYRYKQQPVKLDTNVSQRGFMVLSRLPVTQNKLVRLF